MEDTDGAFTAFVAARGPALLRLAWLLTADADAAQDLVQEALVRVLPRWERIAQGAREAYVRSAIRSIWIDTWRRRRGVRVDLFPELPDPGLDEPRNASLEDLATGRLAIEDALARLTARQRAVLVLRFYEDLTEAETARILGCAVATVKSQTRHALHRLRVLAPDLAEAFGRSDVTSHIQGVHS